jgi:hypothetical protein
LTPKEKSCYRRLIGRKQILEQGQAGSGLSAESAAKDPEYQQFLKERLSNPFYRPPDKITPYLDEKRKVVREIMSTAGLLKE